MVEDTHAPSDTESTEIVPSHVRVLANGTWLDTETHKFLPGHKPTSALDSMRGSQLAARRQELAKQSARAALASKAEAEGLNKSPVAAYGLLAGLAYDSATANMLDKPREAVEAGKFSLRLAGMLPSEDKTAQAQVAVQVNIDSSVLERVAGRHAGRQATEDGNE